MITNVGVCLANQSLNYYIIMRMVKRLIKYPGEKHNAVSRNYVLITAMIYNIYNQTPTWYRRAQINTPLIRA